MCRRALWLLVGASLLVASGAWAGMSYSATSVLYLGNGKGTINPGPAATGSFTITPAPGPTLDVPAGVLQQTAVLTYTVNGGAAQLGGTGPAITANNASTAWLASHPAATQVPFQAYVTVKWVTTTHSAAGSFGPGGGENGGFGGSLSLGTISLMSDLLFAGAWVPYAGNIPLSVIGVGGTIFGSLGSNIPQSLPLRSFFVTGHKWTTGAVSGSSSLGGSSFSVQGTNMLTASGRGRMTLVTPFVIDLGNNVAVNPPGVQQRRVGYAALTLVPEPGSLLLVGAALVGLLGVESLRQRANRREGETTARLRR